MAFRVAAAQCKKICPERLNWPGRLAGISKGHQGISKYFFQTTYHHHFKPKMVSNLCKNFLCIAWHVLKTYGELPLVARDDDDHSNFKSRQIGRIIVRIYSNGKIFPLFLTNHYCHNKRNSFSPVMAMGASQALVQK